MAAQPATTKAPGATLVSGDTPKQTISRPGWYATLWVMAFLFATMCALTLGLWRHLGRSYAAPEDMDGNRGTA